MYTFSVHTHIFIYILIIFDHTVVKDDLMYSYHGQK